MSKRLGILLLVAVLGAAAIFGYFIYSNQQAERTLDNFLASNPFITASQHGPVTYNAAKGDLEIEKLRISLSSPKGVSLEIGFLDAEGVIIESDSLTDINELTLRDIKILTPTGVHRIDQISAAEVKVDSSALDAAQNITISDIAQSLVSHSVQVTGVKFLIDKNTAQISMNKVHLNDYQKGIVEEFGIEGIRAREPSAKSYFSLETLTMEDLDARQIFIELSEHRPLSLQHLWARNIILKSFSFTDDTRGQIASISDAHLQRGEFVGGWPRTSSFALNSLEIKTEAASTSVDTSMLQALGYETFKLTTKFTQKWSPETGSLKLQDGSFVLGSAGTLSYDLAFIEVDPDIFANGLQSSNLMGLRMITAAIGYQDSGLLERIIASSAARSGQSSEQAKTQLLTSIHAALSSSPLAMITDDLSQAMTKLIDGGAKIVLTARPVPAITIGELLQPFFSGEIGTLQQLNLVVSHSTP